MASLKEVKNRIASVQSTRKITSTMKMVASAKLHKAQEAIENMLPYQTALNKILTNFLSADLPVESPFVQQRKVKRVGIVVFSSNSSLCGAFNANVQRMLVQLIDEYRPLGDGQILIFPIGRKIEEATKKLGFVPQGSFQELSEKPSCREASALAEQLMELFLSKEVDRVEVVYHHFKSMGVQTLLRERFLPIDLKQLGQGGSDDRAVNDYIIEPSVEQLIAQLIPTVLHQKIFTSSVDSNASEHAARALAMQMATENANELIQDLTKQYNKSRQQTITNELLDIIGGSMK